MSISCSGLVDTVTGTAVVSHATQYRSRCSTYPCECQTNSWCNNAATGAANTASNPCGCDFSVCGSIKDAYTLRVASSSRQMVSWVHACTANKYNDVKMNSENWAAIMYKVQYVPEAGNADITPPAASLLQLGWINNLAEFGGTVSTLTPFIVDLTKLPIDPSGAGGSRPAFGMNLKYWLNNPADTYPLTHQFNTYNDWYNDVQTHYAIQYSSWTMPHYNFYTGNTGSNYTAGDITLDWASLNMQLKWSIPNQLVYRSYYFQISARNIVYTGVSDRVIYRFVCNPDNSGSTVTPPAIGYAYGAFQVGAGLTASAGFDAWALTVVHSGCYFLQYGIAADPLYPTEVNEVTYPNPDPAWNWGSTCYTNINNCRALKVLDRTTARSIRF